MEEVSATQAARAIAAEAGIELLVVVEISGAYSP